MRTRVLAILAAAAGPFLCVVSAEVATLPSIVRITLPAEDQEQQPFTLPTEPDNTLEVEFPWPLEDWAGRGFTPDPEHYAGDFVVEATRGRNRIFVTPVAGQAHRVLHVVLRLPDGHTRSIPIEFLPSPAGLAWRKVVFEGPAVAGERPRKAALLATVPRPSVRDPSPESEIGLLRTLRLLANSTPSDAAAIAAANPALEFATRDEAPRSFGDYTLVTRFALRDTTTDSIGLCVGVANQSARRLLFRPDGWVLRAGDRTYPLRTVDFGNELEPGSTADAFLVLSRGPGGEETRLLPDSPLELSALLADSVNPRPVRRMNLPDFEP
jgi:hypothetical protein